MLDEFTRRRGVDEETCCLLDNFIYQIHRRPTRRDEPSFCGFLFEASYNITLDIGIDSILLDIM
jgi:hypothetical protein